MSAVPEFENEPRSNEIRRRLARCESRAQRTRTPTQAVLARSAGLYHWTPDGRRLADFTSGVLVANLGHHPSDWLRRLSHHMGWSDSTFAGGGSWSEGVPFTAYNAITPLEADASQRLLESVRRSPLGSRLEKVLWAASGSEAIQKSIWASWKSRPGRDMILATRDGFHGKKGIAGATSGNETSPERDPRVRFLSFPIAECRDRFGERVPFNPAPYREELARLQKEFGGRLGCLVTEPYLGGGGSYHPPAGYLELLVEFCREHNLLFILDEVQSNFGRTGSMYAFESRGIEPDIVVLGKGMGNGVPVNALIGRADVLDGLDFGDGSDTWSAHPLGCAAVLATLDVFEQSDVLDQARRASEAIERELRAVHDLEIVAAVRGEGMVWGIEFGSHGSKSSHEVASLAVERAYLGEGNDGVHLLGPLAGNVVRVSPPLTITIEEIRHWFGLLRRAWGALPGMLDERAVALSQNQPWRCR